ncbi:MULTISPECIES: SRPBCC family protein [unclassified Kribbella]|uniref:SRPBCC family protein n=1 Tax=unclassified Kribbella TaxID=2644121 RepID=UPI003076C45A
MPDLSESITVSAPALSVYNLVSDLPRMGEWSPECTRVTWSSRTPGPAVGARFVGHNRVGAIRWFTQGRVVDAVPGERFSFQIHFGPIPISLWTYDFKPSGLTCEITESWTDHRPTPFRLLFRPFFGNRTPRNAHGIHTTLQRLKSTAEAAAGAS